MFKSLLSDFSHASMSFGWKLRECQKLGPHWVQFAFAPFFLFQSAIIFRLIGDFYGYSESIDHMVYWFKMLSLGIQRISLGLAQHALSTMSQHRPEKRASALRALVSVHMSMGNYTHALSLIDEYLSLQKNLVDRADMLSHKSTCLLNSGHIVQAGEVIKEAITTLDEVPLQQHDFHWAVWYTRALIAQSKLLFAQGKIADAKSSALLAASLAHIHKVSVRLSEANEWLEAMKQIQKT